MRARNPFTGQPPIASLNAIEYKGGWTNTQQAIAQCEQTLSSAAFGSLRYILLFTDGTPTTFADTSAGLVAGE